MDMYVKKAAMSTFKNDKHTNLPNLIKVELMFFMWAVLATSGERFK